MTISSNWRHHVSIMVIILIPLLLADCGTARRNQMKGIYPATKGDVILMRLATSKMLHLHGKVPLAQQVVLRPVLLLVGIVDLPISLLTDTLLLPHDLKKQKAAKQ